MRQTRFLYFIVLTFAFSALGAEYRDPERKFSFSYDEAGWELVPQTEVAKKSGADVDRTMASMTLVTVQKKKADDKYRSRFSVVVDSLKKFPGKPEAQLKAYQAHTVDFLKGQRFHVTSVNPVKLPGVPYPSFEVMANQRDFGLTFRQVVFLKNDEAYLLSVATRIAKFDEYAPETRKFFDTFRMP